MQTQMFHSHQHWGNLADDSFFAGQPHGCSDSEGLALIEAEQPIHHSHAPVEQRRQASDYTTIFQRALPQSRKN